MIRGAAVHKAIEMFYKLNINHCSHFDYFDFKRCLRDLLWHEWKDRRKAIDMLGLTDTEIDYFFHDSVIMMEHFAHDFYKNQGLEKPTPVIEKTFISKTLGLKGRVDAIHYNQKNKAPPLIIDYKTCKSKEVKESYKRQLFIYALLYFEEHKTIPDIGIHFLNFRDGVVKIPFKDDDLHEIKKLVKDIHDKTQLNHIESYPCTCGWCKMN